MTEARTEEEKLNDLVALNIMKYHRTGSNGYKAWSVPINEHMSIVMFYSCWTPSTDMQDAYKVLEKFPWNDWDIIICRNSRNGWDVKISKWSEGGEWIRGDSLPKAICRAALFAVGIEVVEEEREEEPR